MAGLSKVSKTTPATPSLKKSSSGSQSSQNQTSIASFFQKKLAEPATKDALRNTGPSLPARNRLGQKNALRPTEGSDQSLTPAPSSDPVIHDTPSKEEARSRSQFSKSKTNGLPSPITPAGHSNGFCSPSRNAKKVVTYAESDQEEDEEDAFDPSMARKSRARPAKRRKMSVDSDDDIFVEDAEVDDVVDEDDFVVADDSEDNMVATKKRKRPSAPVASHKPSPSPSVPLDLDIDLELPAVSTAQNWSFDPEAVQPLQVIKRDALVKNEQANSGGKKPKPKAHTSEPEKRYEWLANLRDGDRHPPSHPDYDCRTIYIPPKAWSDFSPFEKQYWEIKQKFMDTIVFFKKGKFYELYENDATVGHQLFDLKLTDRVNMRMVGVPEMSLNHWANQFVAKGYKIARVDQQETALGKEMRERDGASRAQSSKPKIIERKLACVLTRGTLVDGGMLQDDMSTYCVAIKQGERDGLPAFGISVVDAATAQFSITEFVDDVDLTKFETFIAQTRPQELILEKSCISAEANRIIKNNTGPTTIRNELKPGKEFWSADITCREIDASKYFASEDIDDSETWPQALRDSRDMQLLMSSFGALIQYLRTLQIERELLTLRNITWYDPISKASSLVLDGKTLINLEIFANSIDGGSEGTLFALLNRCITPFGKRMFKQWMCHPLMDANRINARLDAVDALNADSKVRERFTSQLSKLPDLERMISRIHAGSCKPQDFVRVLDGFEQIDYTMSLVREGGPGEGIIGHLIASMPDMTDVLQGWKDAFDHAKAKEAGLLIPERGVEADFDDSQDRIEEIEKELQSLLKRTRKQLNSNAIEFRDNGKEIYQLEVPVKVKGVPKSWDQMSATQKVKRYYTPELRTLVRSLQEAQETHAQIVKSVSSRFFARFDADYPTWLAAVRVIAHLDCLISLAKASAALGEPSCRPTFLPPPQNSNDRGTLNFDSLRHPCIVSTSLTDFIPNTISLGGDQPNINLLTGANAAGKSTILRMTCIAVIMAQIGCHLPCTSASLTPVDRIMSRLGANDNIFAAQSTFFVELAETKKILTEATPRSLVILDELGRGTSSYDGVAVAEAVLHHVATHIGCVGFFATHYHSLAASFATHPEIRNVRMAIHVDDAKRLVTFLYRLEEGVAEGSFGMHCAAMCGIPAGIVEAAEVAAQVWEDRRLVRERGERESGGVGNGVGLGWCSDLGWVLGGKGGGSGGVEARGLEVLRRAVAGGGL